MPTRAEVAVLDRLERRVVSSAEGALRALWERLDWSDPVQVRDGTIRVLPVIVDTYGEAAAASAAWWFDEVRADRFGPARQAVVASTVPSEAVSERVRYFAGRLFEGRPEVFRSALEGATQRYVLSPGRETILGSVAADPARPRWTRVPMGANPCAFCVMLAGRGAVYLTPGASEGFHDDCWCKAVPVWEGDSLGFDPAPHAEMYRTAKQTSMKTARSKTTKAILAQMREMYGLS